MDVNFRFPPPIQLLYHEQAKSIVAIQEIQNELSSLLEFKHAILESNPDLESKLGGGGVSSKICNSHNEGSSNPSPLIPSGGGGSKGLERASSWNLASNKYSSSNNSAGNKEDDPLQTNVSDSGFGGNSTSSSSDLKDPPSLHAILLRGGDQEMVEEEVLPPHRRRHHHPRRRVSVDELNEDELSLLLDAIHRKTLQMKGTATGYLDVGASDTIKPSQIRPPLSSSFRKKSSSSLHHSSLLSSKTSPPTTVAAAAAHPGNTPANHPQNGDDIVHSVQIRTRAPPALMMNSSGVNIEIKSSPSGGLGGNNNIGSNVSDENRIAACSRIRGSSTASPPSFCHSSLSRSNSIRKSRPPSPIRVKIDPHDDSSWSNRITSGHNGLSTIGSHLKTHQRIKNSSSSNVVSSSSRQKGLSSPCSSFSSPPSHLSELNLSKIGKTERLDLRDVVGGGSLGSGGSGGGSLAQENKEITREKIRKVLNINNVIELQRQLLGTVIENEFFKYHLEKLWEAWSKRMKDFESQNEALVSSLSNLRSENESLQASLSSLKSENESLKSQVLRKQKTLHPSHHSSIPASSGGGGLPNPPPHTSYPLGLRETAPYSWMTSRQDSQESNKGSEEILHPQLHMSSPGLRFIQPDSLLELLEEGASEGSTEGVGESNPCRVVGGPEEQEIVRAEGEDSQQHPAPPPPPPKNKISNSSNSHEFYDSISHEDSQQFLAHKDEKDLGPRTPDPSSSTPPRKLIIPHSSETSFNSSLLLGDHPLMSPPITHNNSNNSSSSRFNHHPGMSSPKVPHPSGSGGGGSNSDFNSLKLSNSSNGGGGSGVPGSNPNSSELRRIPITEKLKRKILGW